MLNDSFRFVFVPGRFGRSEKITHRSIVVTNKSDERIETNERVETRKCQYVHRHFYESKRTGADF